MLPTWIFDLDNTLHDARPTIFPQMKRHMTAYIAHHLELDAARADRLRVDYWRQYGSTLAGLMRHTTIDPEHFLRETHRFPRLAQEIRPMRGLSQVLRHLPGRKFLFTNAPCEYALAVLDALHVAHRFEGIIAIQQTGFRPKPDIAGYRRLLAHYHLRPRDCIMVEDDRSNLHTAKRLGMRTIWLSRELRRGAAVDHRISGLWDLTRIDVSRSPGKQ